MTKEELEEKLKNEELGTEEQIQLRGKLIKQLKDEIKKTKDQKILLSLKLKLYEELKKHKQALKERGKEDTIPIPERVGLKVNEIATSISILKEKMDVETKLKTTAVSTVISSLLVGAITVGVTAIAGAPLSIAALATAVPTICYCGLSGLIRMPFTETTWTKLIKSVDSKDVNQQKIIEFIDKNVKNDKELAELIKRKSENPSEAELIDINNKLIAKYQNLVNTSPIPEMSKILTFEKINLMEEQKKIYENIKKEYVKSKREMTPMEFAELEKNLIAIDLGITKENAFLKEVLKESGKDLAISAGSSLAARAIMSAAFPQYAITNIANLATPLVMSTLGNVANMGNLKDKIRLEKESYDKLKTNLSREKIQELMNSKKPEALAVA